MSLLQRFKSHIWVPKSVEDLKWLFFVNPAHYTNHVLPPAGTYRFPSPASQLPYKKALEKDARRNGLDPKTSVGVQLVWKQRERTEGNGTWVVKKQSRLISPALASIVPLVLASPFRLVRMI